MKRKLGLLAMCAAVALVAGCGLHKQSAVVLVSRTASPLEGFAARELAGRLSAQLGQPVPIATAPDGLRDFPPGAVLVSALRSSAACRDLVAQGRLPREERPQGYAAGIALAGARPSLLAAVVCGADDAGTLYGVRDLTHYHMSELLQALQGRAPARPILFSDAPRIANRGLWTWAGRIYDYRGYLDHMSEWKMNLLVVWNRVVPTNAREVITYAHHRGIRVVWGYSWAWEHQVCPSNKAQRQEWKERVLATYRSQYAPLHPDGIYFQVFTEAQLCRCPACRRKTEGQLVYEWCQPIIEALLKENPSLWVQAGLHYLPDMGESYSALARLDPRVAIIWEDLGAFPFTYEPTETTGSKQANELVTTLGRIRSGREDFGLVVKGFYNGLWGPSQSEPMGVTGAAEPRRLAQDEELVATWARRERAWRANLPMYLATVRTMAQSPARGKTLLALVENGLWEARQWLPVVLFAEGAWNPDRPAKELISQAASCPAVVSLARARSKD